jgi:hypothetical protein
MGFGPIPFQPNVYGRFQIVGKDASSTIRSLTGSGMTCTLSATDNAIAFCTDGGGGGFVNIFPRQNFGGTLDTADVTVTPVINANDPTTGVALPPCNVPVDLTAKAAPPAQLVVSIGVQLPFQILTWTDSTPPVDTGNPTINVTN